MTPQEALDTVLDRRDLEATAAETLMQGILAGDASPEWIAGFLVALRMKGETAGEITGFARAMRSAATPVPCTTGPLVDTCGTGGDGAHTFNISTTAAFVVAGAGGRVAKHGNRSVSSRCGSADVLEALGANLDLDPAAVGRCVDEVGFGFLFAPRLHGAMKHAVGPRRALGVRTVFNLLGPLTNPAGAAHQVIGVFDAAWLDPMAAVLASLGVGRSLVVHGDDGLDELTVTGPTQVRIVDGGVTADTVRPEDVGLATHPAADLAGGDATENAEILRRILRGEESGARRDITLLNAGAALFAAGLADDLRGGVEAAGSAVDSGRAQERLEAYIAFTRGAA